MEELDDIVLYNKLYDLYKGLLTDKQREYFEDVYFLNLSFSEIAEENNISRSAVHSQLKIVKNELLRFDEILKLSLKDEMIEELKNLNNEDVLNIIKKYEEV